MSTFDDGLDSAKDHIVVAKDKMESATEYTGEKLVGKKC